MKLNQLLKNIEPLSIDGKTNIEISGIVYDSRKSQPGSLFFAVSGHAADGLGFVESAVKNGAVAVVSEKPISLDGVTNIVVENSRTALAYISKDFYGVPFAGMDAYAVTGTNGKTTTSFMIRNILKIASQNPGLIGTVRYEVGDHWISASRTTPESADIHQMLAKMNARGCKSYVIEVSSHALIQGRVRCLDFDVAVFTNLSPEHLDYHETMEQYFQAKRILFSMLESQKKPAVAVINGDCEWGLRLAKEVSGISVLTYGFSPVCDVCATEVGMSERGSIFNINSPWGEFSVQIHQAGHYNILNALAAFTACCARGISAETAIQGLSLLESVPGRLERVLNPQGLNVLIDYAHTSDALENVLTALRQVATGRLAVVFGCGGNRDTSKRKLMGEVASKIADFSIVTTDNPRKEVPSEIISQIVEGFDSADKFEIHEDREEAIKRGLEWITPNDVLLIAGKGHENYQEFANTVIPFSDREVVERILGMN